MYPESVVVGRSLHVDVLGLHFELRVAGSDRARLFESLCEAWAACLVTPDGVEPAQVIEVVVTADQTPRAPAGPVTLEVVGPDVAHVLHDLSPVITSRAITLRAGELVMVHAAALADPDTGTTAVLVGPSGAGKTTLARALGRRLAYLTDETVAVDEDLRITPYPKPLSVLPSTDSLLKEQLAPGALGLVTERALVNRVGVVVFLDRSADWCGAPEVTPVDIVDALPELAAQTSYSGRLDRPLHRLAGLLKAGGCYRVTYAEAADLLPVVTGLLGGPGVTTARRLLVVDEYVENGRAAVFVGDTVVALSELATFTLHLIGSEGLPLPELADRLGKEFGAPEDASVVAATEAVLRELATHHLVELC